MTSMPFDLDALQRQLTGGGLTCDLSDASEKVAVLPSVFHWCNHETPFVGTAFTVDAPEGDLDAVYAGIQAAPRGSVLLVATGGVPRAIWGETTTRFAQENGLAGVVLDGACRDVKAVKAAALPVVACGVNPKRAERNGRGEIDRVTIIRGVTVHPGDIVVSDENGTVIVSQTSFNTIITQLLASQEESQ